MTSGYAAERELSNQLEDEFGFAAMPAGGSGSGTDRARPDVIAGHRSEAGVPGASEGTYVAIEVKKRTSDWPTNVQLNREEVEALQSFATRFGAQPWVVVRPHRGRSDQDWHCWPAAALGRTDGGNWAIRQADLPARRFRRWSAMGDHDRQTDHRCPQCGTFVAPIESECRECGADWGQPWEVLADG